MPSDRVSEPFTGQRRGIGAHEPKRAFTKNRRPAQATAAHLPTFGRAAPQWQARRGGLGTRRPHSGLLPREFQKDIFYSAPNPAPIVRARPTVGSDRGKHDQTLVVMRSGMLLNGANELLAPLLPTAMNVCGKESVGMPQDVLSLKHLPKHV